MDTAPFRSEAFVEDLIELVAPPHSDRRRARGWLVDLLPALLLLGVALAGAALLAPPLA